MKVINLRDKLARFSDLWNPRIIAELNENHVKLAKVHGTFVWHRHDDEDELFLVVRGRLTIHLRDRCLDLGERQDLVHALMRAAFASGADVAVVTAQDLLRLGRDARMNTPGTSGGNWQWRFEAGALNADLAGELASLTETFGRQVIG